MRLRSSREKGGFLIRSYMLISTYRGSAGVAELHVYMEQLAACLALDLFGKILDISLFMDC